MRRLVTQKARKIIHYGLAKYWIYLYWTLISFRLQLVLFLKRGLSGAVSFVESEAVVAPAVLNLYNVDLSEEPSAGLIINHRAFCLPYD